MSTPAPILHRHVGRALIVVLVILALPSGAVLAQANAPWRALYRGTLDGESLWLDLTVQTLPPPAPAPDGSYQPARYMLVARVQLPERDAVLFGRGSATDDGGLELEIRDSDGGRGEPGAPGAAGSRLGHFRGVRSLAPNDDGRTVQGTLLLDGSEAQLAAHRVAQYAYRSYHLGPIEGSLALPHFMSGPWQPINDPLEQDMRAGLEAFLVEGRAGYQQHDLWRGWAAENETTVQGISSELLSLLTRRYRYTGGAHGNHDFEARTYVQEAGRPRLLALPELLLAGPRVRAQLTASILADLRRQGASWVVNGDVSSLTDDDLALFSLTPAGLQFVFPPYAMGSYAEGPYTVTLPYPEVRGLAPTDGWLTRFANQTSAPAE